MADQQALLEIESDGSKGRTAWIAGLVVLVVVSAVLAQVTKVGPYLWPNPVAILLLVLLVITVITRGTRVTVTPTEVITARRQLGSWRTVRSVPMDTVENPAAAHGGMTGWRIDLNKRASDTVWAHGFTESQVEQVVAAIQQAKRA